MNTLLDPAGFPITWRSQDKLDGEMTQMVDIVNFAPDNNVAGSTPTISVRNGYAEVLTDGVYTDGFSNGTIAYVVKDGVFCSFDGQDVVEQTILVADVTTPIELISPVSYVMINDTIAFSDGVIFGLISPQGDISIATDDAKWAAITESTQWEDAGNENTWYSDHDPGAMGGVKILDGGTF
jgi:hypothetical protein